MPASLINIDIFIQETVHCLEKNTNVLITLVQHHQNTVVNTCDCPKGLVRSRISNILMKISHTIIALFLKNKVNVNYL